MRQPALHDGATGNDITNVGRIHLVIRVPTDSMANIIDQHG